MHDYLIAPGGAERALDSLAEIFPEAPIYTAIYRPTVGLEAFAGRDIRPLWTDKLPIDQANYRSAILAFAIAFEGLELADFDLVLSSSSGFAKSAGGAARVRCSYCYTPPRFIWPCGQTSEAASATERVGTALIRPVLKHFDLKGARRVDSYAGISRVVVSRIRDFYGRDATLIRPPMSLVRTDLDSPGDREGFLTVGRLLRYKGYDQTIQVCSAAGYPLTVVGTGPDLGRLESIAGETVRFVGRVEEAELARLYASASALVVTAEEDAGLTPLEANAFGCPVVAAAHGGNLESVIDGETGILFAPGDLTALRSALDRVPGIGFDAEALRHHANRYGKERFRSEILDWITEAFP